MSMLCHVPFCATIQHKGFPMCKAHWQSLNRKEREELYDLFLHKKAKTRGARDGFKRMLSLILKAHNF